MTASALASPLGIPRDRDIIRVGSRVANRLAAIIPENLDTISSFCMLSADDSKSKPIQACSELP